MIPPVAADRHHQGGVQPARARREAAHRLRQPLHQRGTRHADHLVRLTPLQTWLDDLHRHLHLGVVGRHYSELAASWLWLVALGGLFLWLRRQWTGRRKLRRTVLPDLAAKKGVRRTRGWHAATGVWLVVGLLALSATGLTWSRYAGANFDVVQEPASTPNDPMLDTALPGGPGGGDSGGGHHGGAASSGGDVLPLTWTR